MPAQERLPSMLELKGICKRYVTQSFTQVALDNVSLSFRDNEFVAILGPSGSGKTTMLNVIGGLDHFDSGDLLIDGISTKDFHDRDWDAYRNNRIGFVFQSYNLIPHQTILENVELALTLTGVGHAECRQRAREALEKVGLGEHVNKRPSQLSGGQKQRVAIARALATRPKYLLCDEATSALDPNTTQAILRLLKQINQTLGVTIVVITHEMRVIEQICQRVAVIDQSCIAEIGNVSDVFTHPKSDIAKALILPKSPTENLPPCTGKRLRLVFDGSCSNEPVISRITLECGVPVNILFADTRIVEGSIYGHMVIDLPSDPQQFHDVLRWLEHNHISYLQEV